MSDPVPDERRRLTDVYGAYEDDGSTQRWDPGHPGNACILGERDRRVHRLVQAIPPPARTLEIGCGRGDVVGTLPITGGQRIGIDLLADRLQDAARDRPGLDLVLADASRLPLPSRSIDLLVAFTVLSSVGSEAGRRAIASEITRVARPGADLLWYDMRWPNPANRAVRPVRRRDLGELFPQWEIEVESITLVPALARRLGRATERWYPRLAGLGFLRSHLVGVLRRV